MPEVNELKSSTKSINERLTALSDSLGISDKRKRFGEVEKLMAGADFWNDQEKAMLVVNEMKALKGILEPFDKVNDSASEAVDYLELAEEENDADAINEVAEQIGTLHSELASLETLALLSGPHDREPCFFSIHTGAGGSDACEWAEMLLRMYLRFFENRKWKVEELDFLPGEEAGIKKVDLRITGAFAYGYLRSELGVHRLVRISPFSGKRETSFAAIDVVPDFQEEIDIVIDEKDLRIDTYRSSGKGGQHVNKTDSAVRITHLPSGLVVAVQNERSQHKNRDVAMKILKSRLKQKEEAERAAAADKHNATKVDNAWGSQIRNYVMHPYQLVKDVRTGCETGNISRVLDGGIDEFIDAGLRWSLQE